MTMSKSSAAEGTVRAYASRIPTYQRFHPNATSGITDGSGVVSGGGGGSNPYARQYSHVYSARLTALRSRCLDGAYRSIRDGSVIITNNEEGGGNKNNNNDIMKEITTAERIIEAPDSSWSILVGTVVREVHPDRRIQHMSPSSIMDAHSFLFPPTTAATKKNGKAIVEPLRTQIMFDARAGDILHLEDESGRVELETDDTVSFVEGNEYALDPNTLVTGVVIAVVGRVDGARGVMKVRSVHFAGPPRSSSTNDGNDATTPRGRGVLRGPTIIHGTIDGDGMEGDDEDDGPFLLLISGLGCGADSPTDLESGTSLAVRREMLLEYLTNPTLSDGSSICFVIVAGGGVAPPVIDDGEDDDQDGVDGGGGETTTTNGNKRKNYNIEASAKSSSIKTKTTDAANRVASTLAELDIFLSEILACGIPVDYVPGYHDPTNANWPQRPIHPCLLPRSCGYVDLFGRGTNPYECILGSDEHEVGSYEGVRVLGSDGLNVADLRRFLVTKKKDVVTTTTDDDDDDGDANVAAEVTAGVPSSIDALNRTLVYGHVAPTGPDSLPTFPSSECDPFVISSRPDVYFAGNCEQFETRLVNMSGNAIDDSTVLASGTDDEGAMTRLVCVPSFSLTGEVVLVKLKTLECEVMSFNDLTL